MRYVDIDKPVIVTIYNDPFDDKKTERITTTIAELLDGTMEVLEEDLVRCEHCVHRYVDGENVRFNVCELGHNRVQSDEWFCGDGERKVTG